MRPKKTRWIKCEPGERCFRPQCKPLSKSGGVYLTLDEFEAVRLSDVERLKQEEAAKKMQISRPTFSRIITSAHQKIGDALVNVKAIRIEGGCCEIKSEKKAK
ncbi:MAG: DUF134 domain-containing protein [Candidatus Omnitrophica bacterium]|nr:DUF134 domain-containing protein [Candidatus Omnitrophota bacterium]